MTYEKVQNSCRTRAGIADTAATLLDKWSAFVDECADAYEWDYSEYLNEIAVRDAIETVLESKELAGFAEHTVLRQNVDEIDRRFRALLRPDAELPEESYWWRRGILRRAGEMYADYMKAAHGLDVARIGDESETIPTGAS